MSSTFSQGTSMARPTRPHLVGSSDRHGPLAEELFRPLSLCERWSLGFGLIVASVVIEVLERLPRLDRFKPKYQPFRFATVTVDPERRPSTVKAEIVDLRPAERSWLKRPTIEADGVRG